MPRRHRRATNHINRIIVNSSSSGPSGTSRRDALRILWGGITAAFLAPILYIVGRYLAPPIPVGSVTVVGREDALPAGGDIVVKVGLKDAFVARRADGSLYALDLACTHAGCGVSWNRREHQFLCPCHDGRFSREGAVLGGPPTIPLHRLAVETRRGLILVSDDHA